MLVLSPKDIKYCQLSYENDFSRETYPGISYQGFLLARVASFTYHQYEQAVAICRECLKRDKPFISIIIKEKNKITLWSEIYKLNAIVGEQELVSHQNINSQNKRKTLPQNNLLKYRGKKIIQPAMKIAS